MPGQLCACHVCAGCVWCGWNRLRHEGRAAQAKGLPQASGEKTTGRKRCPQHLRAHAGASHPGEPCAHNYNGCGLASVSHACQSRRACAHQHMRPFGPSYSHSGRRRIVGCITLRQKFVPLPRLTLVVCRGRVATAPAQYGSLPQGEMDDGKVSRCPAPSLSMLWGEWPLRCVVPCGK